MFTFTAQRRFHRHHARKLALFLAPAALPLTAFAADPFRYTLYNSDDLTTTISGVSAGGIVAQSSRAGINWVEVNRLSNGYLSMYAFAGGSMVVPSPDGRLLTKGTNASAEFGDFIVIDRPDLHGQLGTISLSYDFVARANANAYAPAGYAYASGHGAGSITIYNGSYGTAQTATFTAIKVFSDTAGDHYEEPTSFFTLPQLSVPYIFGSPLVLDVTVNSDNATQMRANGVSAWSFGDSYVTVGDIRASFNGQYIPVSFSAAASAPSPALSDATAATMTTSSGLNPLLPAQLVPHVSITHTSDPADKLSKISQLSAGISSGYTGSLSSSSLPDSALSPYGIGLFDNADLHLSSFQGQPLDDSDLLLVQAHLGDANLSGIVDIQDQSLITNHWQSPQSAWSAGDLNLDGFVDLQDLAIVTNNWQQSSSFSQLPNNGAPIKGSTDYASSPAPEPSSLLLLTLPTLLFRKKQSPTK